MVSIYTIVFLFGFIHPSAPKAKHLKLPLWAILRGNTRYDEDGFRISEGDIAYHGKNKEDVIPLSERTARKDLKSRWPQGNIPYKIHQSLNQKESKSAIRQAMQLWMDNTCVAFFKVPQELENRPHLVLKHTGSGCSSWIGIDHEYITAQVLSLDHPVCSTSVPVIAHELGHAIGLWHEQDRLDRDTYLKIYLENMGENKVYIENTNDVMNYDVPYEYSSIMQYTPDAFTSNGKLTIVPRDPMAFPLMGNAEKITYLDYKLVNKMYNCSDKCNNTLFCQNDGYATWNTKKGCRCECPPEFAGSKCQIKVPVEPPCSGKITTPTRFQSPNYPNNHPAGMRCAWLIEAPLGKVISLFFHEFALMVRAGDDKECYWSALRIRSGDLLNDDPGHIHCLNELHGKTLVGRDNQMLLVLTSMYNLAKGFDVSVNFV